MLCSENVKKGVWQKLNKVLQEKWLTKVSVAFYR